MSTEQPEPVTTAPSSTVEVPVEEVAIETVNDDATPDVTPEATPEATADATQEATPDATPEAVVPANKLFVGNVFYKTKKSELEELFKDLAVKDIRIPMRRLIIEGRTFMRPRGYVFVTFEEGEDLDKVIEEFNDKEFKGRKLYVLYPNPQTPREEDEEKKSVKAEQEQDKGTATQDQEENTKEQQKKKKKKTKKAPKKKIPFDESAKSLTTLHLKNLDFGIRSNDLKEFFEEKGEVVDWISVPFVNLPSPVLRKLKAQGKTVERKNRGYAFVKLQLNGEESLQEKVDKYSGVELRERAMIASAAYDLKPVEEATSTTDATAEEPKEESEEKEEKPEEVQPAEEEQESSEATEEIII